MSEIYNWVQEDLKTIRKIETPENTKSDLEKLNLLIKFDNEGISLEEANKLMSEYDKYTIPIVSAIDYEGIDIEEVKKRINNIPNITEEFKKIILFQIYWDRKK